ncbi:MAG: helix-turn-helix transcriptional regulator, partial [Actinomycetota bacterium]
MFGYVVSVTHHLLGTAEIAVMLGVSRQRVAQLIETYDDFPAPEAELSAGRIWARTAVETWIASHPEREPGRPEAGEEPRRPRFFGRKSFAMFERFTDRARISIVKAQE